MSPRFGRSSEGPGAASGDGSLSDVLARALAEVAGLSPDAVRVEVSGVSLADLPGTVELRLGAPTAAALEVDTDVGARAAEGPSAPDEDAGGEWVEDDAPGIVARVGSGAEDRDDAEDAGDAPIDLEAEAEAAADFLEGLLDAFDLDGDLQIRVLDDRAEVEITDAGDGVLIGRRGQTLEAIQELTRSALQRRFQRRAHVMVDVDGYRARRVERLLELTDEAIDEVRETGESRRLEPMDSFERKVVHQRVAEAGGLVSNSFGREPGRRVVIERG